MIDDISAVRKESINAAYKSASPYPARVRIKIGFRHHSDHQSKYVC